MPDYSKRDQARSDFKNLIDNNKIHDIYLIYQSDSQILLRLTSGVRGM